MNNEGKTKKRIPWNKGLTKETDIRVKKYCEKLTSKRRSKIVKKSHKNMTEENKEKRANNISIGRKGMKFGDKHCENISLGKLGQEPWNKGTKDIMKPNRTSFKKGDEFSKKSMTKRIKIRRKNGWFKNIEKTRKLKSGERHWNWKGGITKLSYTTRNSFEYRQWRSDVFTRDNFICQECGNKGYLEAHHIKSFAKIMEENKIKTMEEALECEELWNINNGITYCIPCHAKIDKFRGRMIKC